MTDESICDLSALALSRAIHVKTVSCVEVMQAYLARIGRLNPHFNAMVNLANNDVLIAQAKVCDDELAKGASRGWMHGMPQAIKDTGQAAGFPTTFGSTVFKDAVATQDGLMAARMRAAGCIVVGKTNMPEFGLGSHTFNELFGATPNAWDRAVSAGGSSGGAAVALAQRLLPVADGSDFMGSLRNPAGWNNIFGMRPSQGRVPMWPAADVWVSQLGTEGPMARDVADLAALLQTQAGFDARAPLSVASALRTNGDDTRSLQGLRIGWLGDLGGHLATDAGMLDCVSHALQRMADAGAQVEPVRHGFDADAVWQAWLVWRGALVAPRVAAALKRPGARDAIKPEALWEFDQAQTFSLMDFMRASEVRSALYAQLCSLLSRYDVLALPVAQVWPFPIAQRWPQTIAGRSMDTYHRWMESTLYATFAGLPALSMPAGFHPNGRWPAGIQLIGRPQGDAELLGVAAGYEVLIGDLLARRPSSSVAHS